MEAEVLDSYLKAGKIANEALSLGLSLVKVGAKAYDVAENVEERIASLGGSVAFPVNISINDIAAHYSPKIGDELVFTEKDVVKVDVGVHVDGYIADTAKTVDLTGEYGKMCEANEKALDEALKMIRPGVSVSDIGESVQSALASYGFKPIENLTGHEVKQYDLHAGLSIPNIKVPYDWRLKEDMVLAIEPFATDGAGHVIESPKAEIYSQVGDGKVRMMEARSFLKEIEKKQKLPFAARWYGGSYSQIKLSLILKQLVQAEILKAYPPLHDKNSGTVTQYEHTVIVTEDGARITTK
jgi:methionyl aminopeptidase